MPCWKSRSGAVGMALSSPSRSPRWCSGTVAIQPDPRERDLQRQQPEAVRETKTFYCWASHRKGALGEWAAYWCPYEIARPSSPTAEEQVLLGLWLWKLAGLAREEFDKGQTGEEDLNRELRDEQLQRFENARKDLLELREVLPTSVSELLSIRAKAFPVSELAMLPPFMAASASILGTRYRTKVKGATPSRVFSGLVPLAQPAA